MTKWIVLAAVLVVAFWWITRQRDRRRGNGRATADPSSAGSGQPRSQQAAAPGAQPMVACSRCGLYLPQAEAILDADSGQPYCSAEHRRAGPSA